MQAAVQYYDAWDAWINSTNKREILESGSGIGKLAGEIEFLRIERDKENGVIEGATDGSQ